MPDLLLRVSEYDIIEKEFEYFEVETSKNYNTLVIQVAAAEAITDLDIYYSNSQNPTLLEFHQMSNFTGTFETLTVLNPVIGKHFIGVYSFFGTGIGNIQVFGFTAAEETVDDDITDVENDINDDIGDDINIVDGTIGDVTITINQDLSFLQDTIENITENVTEGINDSLDSLEVSIIDSINKIGNLQTESIDGFAESIDESLEGINIGIVESLDEGNILFNEKISEIDNTINESLDSLENIIDQNLANPLIIKLDELNDNIRAISHNTIDELINSVFERIKK